MLDRYVKWVRKKKTYRDEKENGTNSNNVNSSCGLPAGTIHGKIAEQVPPLLRTKQETRETKSTIFRKRIQSGKGGISHEKYNRIEHCISKNVTIGDCRRGLDKKNSTHPDSAWVLHSLFSSLFLLFPDNQ
ncbi:hypothetical protein, unlikely [Trypanosoma brucei gambiense DAL972]|uniref:Uncharacterized protein n=1 Tax=Trypanosoma brucei gambiense (strain MHOM/CI/86/DAL972) TaxID=679716 RepID=C9ZTE3_TRYB9|nr:hypothetical protein, unlikely [Trypanosoma brucei gambiense DAL972]CBH12678.1 hypothetical protein, unlikely [Trypanosoma brucei gambiense DAL972]|eukprot:XP_011774958.1 hypothetical protein, unlikely [Trypanosoma brucei gambiense DAL972]